MSEHKLGIYSIEFIFPYRLASGSDDRTIKIWNIDNGACIRTLNGHSNWVLSVYFISPYRLASGSEDNTIKIWNIDNGECIRTLTGHRSWVRSVELLSPNRLASGSMDGTIKIWNMDNGECIRTLTGHRSAVSSVDFISPNSLASGSYDNTIQIWNIDNGECIRTLSDTKISYNCYGDKLIRFLNKNQIIFDQNKIFRIIILIRYKFFIYLSVLKQLKGDQCRKPTWVLVVGAAPMEDIKRLASLQLSQLTKIIS